MEANINTIIEGVKERAKARGRKLLLLAEAETRMVGKFFVLKAQSGGYLRLKKGECPVVDLEDASIVHRVYLNDILDGMTSEGKEGEPIDKPEAVPYEVALEAELDEMSGFVEFLNEVPEAVEGVISILGIGEKKPKTDGCEENGDEKLSKEEVEKSLKEIFGA